MVENTKKHNSDKTVGERKRPKLNGWVGGLKASGQIKGIYDNDEICCANHPMLVDDVASMMDINKEETRIKHKPDNLVSSSFTEDLKRQLGSFSAT